MMSRKEGAAHEKEKKVNRGIIHKTIRETWAVTLAFGAALAGFEAIIVLVYPTMANQLDMVLQIKFVQVIVQGLLGTHLGTTPGSEILISLAWVHPIALTLLFGCLLVLCTRMPVGEIERGTIDLLLSWPVTRWRVYLSESLVWVGAGMGVILLGAVSNLMVSLCVDPAFRTPPGAAGVIVLNAFCLYWAVGGMTCWMSSMSCRRGRALGWAFAVILSFFFLNFLIQIWPAAEKLSFLSLLHYYRPLSIIQSGLWPVLDLLTLLVVGALFWLTGAAVFCRRDIRGI